MCVFYPGSTTFLLDRLALRGLGLAPAARPGLRDPPVVLEDLSWGVGARHY
jgi:hypothetical protein